MLKAAIVVLLLATIASLFSGLVFLVKDCLLYTSPSPRD